MPNGQVRSENRIAAAADPNPADSSERCWNRALRIHWCCCRTTREGQPNIRILNLAVSLDVGRSLTNHGR